MADPVQRGYRAAEEYEELQLAFLAVRELYTKKALAAHDPESAFSHVLAFRAIDDVERAMRTIIASGKLEEAYQPD